MKGAIIRAVVIEGVANERSNATARTRREECRGAIDGKARASRREIAMTKD